MINKKLQETITTNLFEFFKPKLKEIASYDYFNDKYYVKLSDDDLAFLEEYYDIGYEYNDLYRGKNQYIFFQFCPYGEPLTWEDFKNQIADYKSKFTPTFSVCGKEETFDEFTYSSVKIIDWSEEFFKIYSIEIAEYEPIHHDLIEELFVFSKLQILNQKNK